jgi:hypothetical protein
MEKPEEPIDKHVNEDKEESEEEWIGPTPDEATEPQPKKRKVLLYEKLYIEK